MVKVFSRPPDHHVEISGGPTEVLVDWGHRTTLISSPGSEPCIYYMYRPIIYLYTVYYQPSLAPLAQ